MNKKTTMRKQITEAEYEKIKHLMLPMFKLNMSTISKITKRSIASIYYIKNTSTFSEYRDFISKIGKKRANKVPENNTEVQVESTEKRVAEENDMVDASMSARILNRLEIIIRLLTEANTMARENIEFKRKRQAYFDRRNRVAQETFNGQAAHA